MTFAEPVPDRDGVPLWWVEPADDGTDRAAAERGLVTHRRLLQLRLAMPLPAAMGDPAPTRAFRPGLDDEPWLRANAETFRDHPDQGRWTDADLAANLSAPWFDAEGFRLHEVDGELAAFCWTKLHPGGGDGAMGEIYVIGVRPAFQGRGLGRAMTAAGLSWLWDRHRPPIGMLYVESTNSAARALYGAMGFRAHHGRVAYGLPVPSSDASPGAAT